VVPRRNSAIVAPLVLAACFAAVAPPPASEITELTPATTTVSTSKIDRSGEPKPAIKEEVEPKVGAPVSVGFTRRIDRAKIEARGASRDKAGFDAAVLKAAAAFDNETWSGDARRQLLAWLRREAVAPSAAFTEADARIVAHLQTGSGALADGKLRDETMAVLLAMGLRFTAHKTAWARLDFYPSELEDIDGWTREIENVTRRGGTFRDASPPAGEGSIYVRVGGVIVACYRARGGPPATLQDDAKHVAAPTKPGEYQLGPPHAHVTSNWYFSQIPWGAEIRAKDDGYQYRVPGRVGWSWATKHPAGTLKEPLDATDFEFLPEVTHDGETFSIWNRNDFGPIAWNLVPSDLYVHTTPDAEAGAHPPGMASTLTCSHGCVHIDPKERDEMMKWGYLGVGVPFVVHRWDEHVLPDPVRHDMTTGTGVASTS